MRNRTSFYKRKHISQATGIALVLYLVNFVYLPLAIARPLKVCLSNKTGQISVRKSCKTKRGQAPLDAEVLQGLAISQAIQGPQGPQGPTGPAGPVGPSGAATFSFGETEADFPDQSLTGFTKDILGLQTNRDRHILGDGEIPIPAPGRLVAQATVLLRNSSVSTALPGSCFLSWRAGDEPLGLTNSSAGFILPPNSRTRYPMLGSYRVSQGVLQEHGSQYDVVVQCFGDSAIVVEGAQVSAQFFRDE